MTSEPKLGYAAVTKITLHKKIVNVARIQQGAAQPEFGTGRATRGEAKGGG